ncbi:MAG: DNA polymerase (modular protein) [Promethearchaeota archaeon]|nr:MAG: DNA polymerase (modular protein) [Candidatus Lokiarchaeota archaeon]
MPSKKSKKEKAEDKKQTSLFSFSEKKQADKKSTSKKKKEKAEEKPKEKSKQIKESKSEPTKPIKELEKGKIVQKQKKQIVPEKPKLEPEEITEIPKEQFFKGNEEPFGLLKENIQLEKIKRENFTSRYLRYLIETGEIVENLERGLLLDVDYDGGQNKAYCKFYDLDSHDIKIWIDTTNHEPYCLSKETVQELESNIELTNYNGFERFEEIKRIDLLKDEEIDITKIYGTTPTDIGGSGTNIRNIIKDAWEANIRYHLNYIYDRALIPGLVYKIENGNLQKIRYEGNKGDYDKTYKELVTLFEDEKPEIQEFAKRNLELFLTPIPDVKRMALDIEVMMGPNQTKIPDPKLAKRKIISVSFAATDGLKKVYVLARENFDYGKANKEFPADAEVIFFRSEKKLLEETFRLIWEYPIIITFNGDNFDLNYLFHRANKKRVKRDLNPIQVKRGYGFLSKAECYLRKGVHIDLFNFFFNRSISGYAFGGAYESSSLEDISSALLGVGKFIHEEQIHDMNYCTLAWYNLKDSLLTLELTKFNNSLVWNLIVLLCRITKMPIHDMIRHQISSWIQNILFYEHRQQNYLIPNSSDIREMKKGGYSKSTVEGKLFQGAYVIPPVPGIHFDVVVMDFASLYPTIIKEYNLSYETVLCPHNDCRDNLVKGIPYHTCTHKMGIFAYVTGFLRDVRVKYFKPKSYDKNLTEERRSYNLTIQQALKVFINGCLPYNEEVIIKNEKGEICKLKIGDLEKNWKGKEILSIDKHKENFGKKKFVNIIGVVKRKTNDYLRITLSDGRRIQCTRDHIIPKIEDLKNIKEIEAKHLKIGDELLVLHNNCLNENPPERIFLPNLIPTRNLWISIDRDEYKNYSYRTSESTTNPIIELVNRKFIYSKVSKIYKCLWDDLDQKEKKMIENGAFQYKFALKYGEEAGKWCDIFLDLTNEFFGLLGWYIAEGSADKNRISITQTRKIHPNRYEQIILLIESLGFPYTHDNKKTIRVNSNILKEAITSLCSEGAENKKIPIELLNTDRASVLLKNYYLGDGNLKEGKWKRYSTKSKQLKNDLVYLHGTLGEYCSIVNPKNSKNIYRIINTEGTKYRRKFFGLVNFNGTTPVRIKNIELIQKDLDVFDIETGNGWFVATNGIIVHNCYGVFGSQNFQLFCLPVAESTTGIGQYSIKSTIEKAESMGVKVLYGDTDSVFLESPTEEQMEQISEWSKKELDLDLEAEKTYQFLALSERKKNYIGIYEDTQYVDMKGLLAKKRNTPEFIKKIFSELIEILKNITDQEQFKEAKNEIMEIVRRNLKKIGKEGAFELEDYAINVGMTKNLDKYNKTTPQHVKAALELREITGKETQKGETVSFIKSKTSDGVKALELAKLQDIDVRKYKELLKSALEQVLDALGITFEEIKGIKKMDAFF